MNQTSRNWCFTLNNPQVEESPETWPQETLERVKLCLYQLEMGKEGTLHYQGYLEMEQPIRLSGLKKLLPRAHLEKRKGSRLQALKYCSKEESRLGDPRLLYKGAWDNYSEEYESLLTSGRKKESNVQEELSLVKSKLQEGSSLIEIAEQHFHLWVKYFRAFEKYTTMITEPRNHSVEVFVLQGPTGTGKSKWCMDTYPDAYWKQRSNWWDGYFKHKVVVLDEFYGWIPFDLLLRLCDRYPLLVESKGGQIQMVADTIVLTTNQLPSSWYKSCYFPAFARRVTKWMVMPIVGQVHSYDTWSEASKNMVENVITP